MTAIFVMLAASLSIAIAFLGAFIWSVRKGHYDDDYTPSVRILMDDKMPAAKKKTK
ncbi:cbb3-type cytochrome oxidase assembly protein CcoS [Dyadobacter sp.]|uniref:cbb3-type cytochrome oxidase assembly protein CcoS n=1 Tax=Dyadobacter sp. TaxID=1914288 RepID=UPI003F707A9D